jgi:hypothetical protein
MAPWLKQAKKPLSGQLIIDNSSMKPAIQSPKIWPVHYLKIYLICIKIDGIPGIATATGCHMRFADIT